MIIKILFIGDTKTGKTQLVNRLAGKPFDINYQKTIGLDFAGKTIDEETRQRLWNTTEEIKLQLWSTGGLDSYRAITLELCSSAPFIVYCVDLSEDIKQQHIAEDLQEIRKKNPKAKIILVGTKSDLPESHQERPAVFEGGFVARIVTSSDLPESHQQRLAEIEGDFVARIVTSSPNDIGIDALLQSIAKCTPVEKDEDTSQIGGPLPHEEDKLLEAKDLLVTNSPLWKALDDMHKAVANLPAAKYKVVSSEALALVNALRNPGKSNKEEAIKRFLDNCTKTLNGEHPYIMKTILAVVATAIVTVIVGTLAFAIGLAAGAWSGPGAFFSGLATGSSVAAVTETAVSGAFGLTAGAYTFFKESAAMKALKAVVAEAEHPEFAI
ncbi:Rho GTPase (Miro-like) [Legionella lansingensis]|uniref:Rho GTPase (Miro-like) n=1 Tax=Legionella lansingensis TaxID=45067 RepID=A0A0W0VTW9_9GAMM|nr:GTP-binding protein [Legionella lansingensis]KTD23632.1 Rho GTPase (Miro-like) [Legionella lansingensis]SNV52474.1 Rho GTPase (Miro-like) [Legionella lansingensis]